MSNTATETGEAAATPLNDPAAPASASEERLAYRLLTGPDTREFCARISQALAEGYVLHGSPAATFNGTDVIVAQAIILPHAVARADAAVASAVDELAEGITSEGEYDGEGHA
ncbi:DUF1737 domain-containing protein [Sinomonas terrae]|uniref:DUF1737 domain-containing protein n=1 Tax=Sinomonas terrae TaxID=2908838 RepID=A0ABS9TXE6_9MICC|nr:DUF1737 domain-containing protein [Sinomonas terrae]MCH6468932.1 DUF1737 domain-containing protein [Sinomonas terrae]